MRRSLALCLLAAACSSARAGGPDGQGPGVTFPASFLEGEEQDGGAAAKQELAPDSGRSRAGDPPDPEALRLARQFEYELIYERGKVRIGGVRALRFAEPVVTRREMGRWAIELWIGRELVERVRFDFPLVAAEEPRAGARRSLGEPPSFAEGAVVSRQVLVPASPRARRALLVDRATGERQELPWPPDEPPAEPRRPGDAGVPAD
jgi:hypothetical protein